ncbi:MAG: HAMP domain-containing sensor histidine kinase [Candidatus Saccharimonadales bacterium]
MFKSALLKLTGLYLLILLTVSMFFSFNIYRITTQEVQNRLRRQADFLVTKSVRTLKIDPFQKQRIREEVSSQQYVIGELVYVNILVLIVGGIGSYLLAKRTLRSIESAHTAQLRFAADASHELRTPLTAMQTETEVTLRDKSLTLEDAKQQLRSNLEELHHLDDLSTNLLQLARGQDIISFANIKVSDVINNAGDKVKHAARNQQIKLELTPIPDIYISGDKNKLTRMLVILLDNAIKYSPKNSVISISTTHDHNSVGIHIADQGIGISGDALPYIFDRFYRADSTRSKVNTVGYGLGLPIAEQIVKSHSGRIYVESAIGKGSTFTVRLPTQKSKS